MKDVAKLLLWSLLIPIGVLLLMVLSDLINPYKPIKVEITPDMIIYPEQPGPDDIRNPENWEYVKEVAFNLGIEPEEVTQEQFNERYGE